MRIPVSIHPKNIGIALSQRLVRISQAINGGIAIGNNLGPCDNLDMNKQLAVFGAANTNTDIAHTLGRTPDGYLVVGNIPGGVVYNGNLGAWSPTNINLKATVLGTYKILVY